MLTPNHVQMRQIVKILPKEERQTMLFSATYVLSRALFAMLVHGLSCTTRPSNHANHHLRLSVSGVSVTLNKHANFIQ